MTGSLKGVNNVGLYALMAANLAVFYMLVKGNAVLAGDWIALARNLRAVLPAGVGLALMGIVNAQLSAEAKSRIVFMRWNNPLPGCEAFTRYALSDPRVDIGALERKYGPLPTDHRKQNTLWFRLYKSIDSEPAVVQVHRGFLFARDYTCLALMMVVILGGAGLFQIPATGTALTYLALLALQFLFAGRAARNCGRRLVTTVLAIKGAGR